MPHGAQRIPRIGPRLAEIAHSCGFACGNFEAPVAETESVIPKAGPAIRQDARLAGVLREAGFTAMTLANNHVSDHGPSALARTRRHLEDAGLRVLGSGDDQAGAIAPLAIELEGRRIALFACAEAEFGILRLASTRRPGAAWMLDPSLPGLISAAARESDLVVVQCHAGIEEEILPLPELRALYRSWIRAGAHFVIGHHPHVLQGSETWMHGTIHYSLGNAYFDHPGMPEAGGPWNLGLAVELSLRDGIWQSRAIPVARDGDLLDLDLSPDAARQVELADAALGEGYEEAVDRMALRLWETRYRGYYERCFAPAPGSRGFLRRVLSVFDPSLVPAGKLSDRLMLLHNVRIESHRWIVERALTLLHERDIGDAAP